MTTQIQQTTTTTSPVVVSKEGNSSIEGYIPSGVLIAEILKALREAQNNDMERQQLQAETEQKFYTALGNCGGDPSKGVIAMAAQSIVDAGNEQAAGLTAMGISMAVNAGLSGAFTLGTLGYGIKESLGNNSIEDEMTNLKNNRNDLDGPVDADTIVGEVGKPTENIEMEEFKNGKPSQETKAATRAGNQDDLDKVKEDLDKKIGDKKEDQEAVQKRIDRAVQFNQTISNISSSATQAAGNIIKAPHDAAAAANNAASDVEKTLSQMDTSSANSFKENAQAAAQQALRTAEDLAQIAASQVQVRG